VATLIDDAAAPVVVTRTIVVTPEPPDPGGPVALNPAAITTTLTLAADLTDQAVRFDPAAITVTLGVASALTFNEVYLDPAAVATAISTAATELIDATLLDPAPLAATLDLTAALVDASVPLDPGPVATAITAAATALIDATLLVPVTLATRVTLAAALIDARVMLDPAPLRVTVAVAADLSLQEAGHVGTSVGLPAHVYHDYDPTLLVLRRAVVLTSMLSSFIVGKSKFGTPATIWANIPAATVTINQSYSPDANGTLIIEQQTASISLSYWDNPGPLLYAGDHIELLYAGELLFYGTVDSTAITYTIDPEADKHGATRRVDCSATAAGTYAVMMGRTVKWKNLPHETAINRIRRWVTVNRWS